MKKIILPIIIILISTISYAQLNVNLLGQLTYSQDLSDVWGHVDSLGNEYAIVGVYNGVSIVDISNPSNPNELFFFPGASSIWRDMKTWNNHAYITNESSGGLFIIDLSELPSTSTPNTTSFTGSSYNFDSAHNLYIDENGICYIFGADYGVGGAILLDLTQDPMAPVELGVFNTYYIHDGMARGDTLWASHISNGFQSAIDVSNKSNPTMMSNWNTPSNFTHNCWISDDGNSLFTTDEKSDAYIGAYDVSDIFNVTEIDRIQSNPGSGVIPHNTHFLNDYIITSYYRDGITIHDVTLPGNMIEVGNYDSYAQGSGNGFNGCWGVYPWLPSGNIIATDIENGFFVLGPNYVRGCYLEGIVTDSITGLPIVGATVTLLLPNESANTDITGNYQMGIADSGTYTVVVSAPGYNDDTLTVTLINGVLVVLNADLYAPQAFSLSGQVVSSIGGTPVANAFVLIENGNNSYAFNADGNGNFTIPSFSEGSYDIVAGQWNYISSCNSGQNILASMGILTITLDPGIYDDFSFDFGWSVSGTATTGDWERGEPYGTFYNSSPSNPDEDIQSDCLDNAYVTGNNNSNNVGNDDVDNGNVVLTSPVFDLSTYNNPYIEYYTWFFNDGGNSSPDDTLKISITNGTNTFIVESIVDNQATSSWEYSSFVVSDYISLSSTMQVIVETSDLSSSGNLVEAGFDYFRVYEGCTVSSVFSANNTSICQGDSIEFINSSIGATSYNWYLDNAPLGNTLNINYVFGTAGTYTISLVAYDSTCVDSSTQTIIVGTPPLLSTSSTNPICNNDCNGDASVYTTGGSSPFQYSWNSIPAQNSSIATGLCSGTYVVDVVDVNGCTATTSANLTNPSIMTIGVGSTDASCGNADGSAYTFVSGGVGGSYNYLWDDPLQQTTDTVIGLSAGTYSVIVTDQGGCNDTAFVSVGNVNGPTITVTSIDASCFSSADGSATVLANGGLSPYTYLWDDQGSQTTQSAIGLIAGNYSVTVTDAAGCIAVELTSVFNPNELVVLVSAISSTCDMPNGAASVLVSGGVPPYIYSWDDTFLQTGDTALGLNGGIYNVLVTDSNGCTNNTAVFVESNGNPDVILTPIDASCYGLNDGVVATSISGGAAPFTYLWDDLNLQTSPSATGLYGGTYNLSLTDSNGCTVNENCIVAEPFELLIQVNANDPLVGPCTGNAAVSTSGGTSPYDYLWSTGQTSQVISLLCEGTYNVVVTDANGCSVSGSVIINAFTSIVNYDNNKGVVVFPNPTQGIFSITYKELYNGKVKINIINMLGELVVEKSYVKTKPDSQIIFDLSNYPAGMYFVKLSTNISMYTTNILVK